MDFLGVLLIDAGIVGVLLGLATLVKPLKALRIPTRSRALLVVLGGIAAMIVGGILPVRQTRVSPIVTRLDEFAPVYQFHEKHTTLVAAPRARVYEAIKAVEPDEIRGFRTLTAIRTFGRRVSPGILNPPAREPILQTALRTGFVPLADDPQREIVFGVLMTRGRYPKHPTADDYRGFNQPVSAKATMNFLIEELDATHCRLTTETRIYANDAKAERAVAPYWRTIYPGSALIRRMWLRAIRLRAEGAG